MSVNEDVTVVHERTSIPVSTVVLGIVLLIVLVLLGFGTPLAYTSHINAVEEARAEALNSQTEEMGVITAELIELKTAFAQMAGELETALEVRYQEGFDAGREPYVEIADVELDYCRTEIIESEDENGYAEEQKICYFYVIFSINLGQDQYINFRIMEKEEDESSWETSFISNSTWPWVYFVLGEESYGGTVGITIVDAETSRTLGTDAFSFHVPSIDEAEADGLFLEE